MTEQIVPVEFQPFWQNIHSGFLSFPYCGDCGRFHWYPMTYCPHCRSDIISWQRSTGKGRIFTWTIVHRAFAEDFAGQLPYTLVLLEFDDAPGVRLVSQLIDSDRAGLAIGAAVEPVFPVDQAALPLLKFRLALA
jgi:uncharacterized OB-fold protein